MEDLKILLAENIARLMDMSIDCKSQNTLAKKSGLGQRTISNYLRPKEYDGAPSLDKLQQIAECFGLETWQLIHPTLGDKMLSAQEIQMYRRWKEEMKELTKME